MDVALAIVVFLIGFAIGGGCLWFILRRCTDEARNQERQIAFADKKAADQLFAAKEAAIAECKELITLRDQELEERRKDIAELQRSHAILQTTLAKDHEKFDEKLKLVNDAEKHFKDTFKALASDALKENNKEFDNLAKPVRETLKEINTKITVVNEAATNLGNETGKLVKALQKPEVRGQWGEMHLLRVVEVTGMTDRCDFHEQQVIGEEGLLRPDLVVHLPGDKNLAVDAKAPIRAFLDAAEAQDDESRCLKQREFTSHMREHVRLLGSKAYHQSLGNTPEFVVLYLPTEAIFSAALALDCDLLEYAAKYRVHLAGPTVLITLMRSVAYGWKQQSLATHAKDICNLADELYKRLATFGSHMAKVGSCLNRSVNAYNQAVGSLESRVMPQARRFEQLGAAPDDLRIQELVQVESIARNLQCEELLTNEFDQELIEAHQSF
jgi:DNA recombination protein RmuC